MPNEHETLSSLFSDIADAIREKTGSEETIVADTFPDAIAAIEGGGGADKIQHADIPAFVKNEALDLAAKVKSVQAANSITFIVGSDSHQDQDTGTTHDNIRAGNKHACMAMKVLAYALKVDFCAFLGDYTGGGHSTTIESGTKDIEDITGDINEAFKKLPNFRTTGNHDPLGYSVELNDDYLSLAELYPMIGAYNEIDGETVFGDTTSGYCYRDFTDQKVRVICLNTAEITAKPSSNKDGAAENMTSAQKNWFAQTLYDLGSKTNANQWSFLVLSHHPLDWGAVYEASNILQAYISGETWGSYNYSGHNAALLIANFHGHTHCYNVDKLNKVEMPGRVNTVYNGYRVAIPNMMNGRNNEYGTTPQWGIVYGDSSTYRKTSGTESDTAFCVITVDLTNKIIYAYHYGAGPTNNGIKRRVQVYDFQTTYYNIDASNIHAGVTMTAPGGGDPPAYVAAGDGLSVTLTADAGRTLGDVKITMGGVDVTRTCYTPEASGVEGAIMIPPAVGGEGGVTGHIMIEAYPYKNKVLTSTDDQGNTYNSVGYKADYRFSSDGTETANNGSVISGFIPYNGEVIRIYKSLYDSRPGASGNYLFFYNGRSASNKIGLDRGDYQGNVFSGGVWTFTPANASDGMKAQMQGATYIRAGLAEWDDGLPFTITLDEEI